MGPPPSPAAAAAAVAAAACLWPVVRHAEHRNYKARPTDDPELADVTVLRDPLGWHRRLQMSNRWHKVTRDRER